MSKRQDYKSAGAKFQTKSALYGHVRYMLMLERVCSRFHLIARQLRSRHGNRDTLHVEDEYDVRDLLHALLTLDYDDVRPLEWTPGYAANARTDFLLKLEQIVVVAKKADDSLGAGELAEQLAVDIQKYKQHPGCRTLVCFVYDPEGRIARPHEIENDLSRDRDGLAVRVIIAPQGCNL